MSIHFWYILYMYTPVHTLRSKIQHTLSTESCNSCRRLCFSCCFFNCSWSSCDVLSVTLLVSCVSILQEGTQYSHFTILITVSTDWLSRSLVQTGHLFNVCTFSRHSFRNGTHPWNAKMSLQKRSCSKQVFHYMFPSEDHMLLDHALNKIHHLPT